MANKKQYSNGDNLLCPYCGRKGKAALSHDDLMVVHLVEKQTVIAAATGKQVECEVLVDGCSRFGKMGTRHEADYHEEF